MRPEAPPPCCTLNPIRICKNCGWKACHDHWFDNEPTSIMDKFHVPTVGDDDGECFCGSLRWKHPYERD